jgi:CvfB-like winged helix domain
MYDRQPPHHTIPHDRLLLAFSSISSSASSSSAFPITKKSYERIRANTSSRRNMDDNNERSRYTNTGLHNMIPKTNIYYDHDDDSHPKRRMISFNKPMDNNNNRNKDGMRLHHHLRNLLTTNPKDDMILSKRRRKTMVRSTSTSLQMSAMSSRSDDNSSNPEDEEEDNYDEDSGIDRSYMFPPGTKILVEVISFGVLGASVEVIGVNSHDMNDISSSSSNTAAENVDNSNNMSGNNLPLYATGLILQKEIEYYRQSRNNVDIIRGEVLPAYVEKVRLSGSIPQLDICLRVFGGKAKTEELTERILQQLQVPTAHGKLFLGDKSSPQEINTIFPGISKSTFKKALSALYKQKLIQQPESNVITLIDNKQQQQQQ